jgi:hypothetical protein
MAINSSPIFYVYVYHDENDVPFYVGKGHGSRYLDHIYKAKNPLNRTHKSNKIRKIQRLTGKDPKIVLYKTNITEYEAFDHEMDLIQLIGRRDLGTGPLLNLTDGGDGASGVIHPLGSRVGEKNGMWKNGDKVRGEKNGMWKNGDKVRGEKNGFFGKHHSEESLQKMHGKRCPWSEETRIKMANRPKPIGSKNGSAKLDEEKVRQIKRLLESGMSVKSIANQYGVCQGVIFKIRSGDLWKQVE